MNLVLSYKASNNKITETFSIPLPDVTFTQGLVSASHSALKNACIKRTYRWYGPCRQVRPYEQGRRAETASARDPFAPRNFRPQNFSLATSHLQLHLQTSTAFMFSSSRCNGSLDYLDTISIFPAAVTIRWDPIISFGSVRQAKQSVLYHWTRNMIDRRRGLGETALAV